ncbi:MAG: class I mannose-6-phosphate isomerase [Phycisphaerae bacterium]|nr:class I mannose-6-phosphate isomerase [Phycisphaerae bacterium]
MKPYPLVLEPIFKEKVWGGRRLERLGKAIPEGQLIGESWELADLDATSADGGGGESAISRIAQGEMRGLTLREAVRAFGPNLMGSLRSTPSGGFPLLVKFLDAKENLSVQVHPSPAYAASHPGAHLKTESWYVLDAEPGSVIYKGIKQGVTREQFASHLREGDACVNDLIAVPVRRGDFHHLPSGTCHALGAGVMVAEVQTPSDTTFRVYDWGRTGRAMHLQQALECIHFGPPPRLAAVRAEDAPRCQLVETDFYTVAELNHQGGSEHAIENLPAFPSGGPMVWMVLKGQGRIEAVDGSFRPVEFGAGTTILFPAAMGRATSVAARDATILEVRFPIR